MLRGEVGRQTFADYRDESWQASLFRLALIVLMAGSLAAGPALIRTALGLGWPGYLVPAAAFAGAVGVLTTSLLGRPAWRNRRGMAFRCGEVVLLLVATRPIVWAFSEGFPGADALPAWLNHPELFFTGEFLFAALTLLFVWGFSVGVTADFLELAIQPDEVAARGSRDWGDSRSQLRAAMPMARTETLQRFALRWIRFGVVLVVCAALTRVVVTTQVSGVLRFGLRGLDLRPEATASLVCYFLAGLLLMSHGRLAVLRGRWFNQDVQIDEPLIRRWHVNSLAFVGLLALVALLLPLGKTGWLAPAIEWFLALVLRIMMGIALLIGLLFSMIMHLINTLFGVANDAAAPAQLAPPPPTAIPSQAEMTSRLPAWLGGAVLWTLVVLGAGFLLVNFLRSTELLQGRLGQRLMRWRLWWRARQERFSLTMTRRFKRARSALRRDRRKAAPTPPVAPGMRAPKTARDRVRQYYLHVVQQATVEGVARPGHKTPSEYAQDLAEMWPETRSDVIDLTAAFVDARYSDHEIDAQRATDAETVWRRLVRGLRQTAQGENGESQ